MRRPQFIADQARNARGLLGRLIAFIMARETWRENLRVMDTLSIEQALCVHVLYFWKDIETSLREIARVLKPGGSLGLLFRTNADLKAISSFPRGLFDTSHVAVHRLSTGFQGSSPRQRASPLLWKDSH